MTFFFKVSDAKKVRKRLAENNIPIDEEVFCSALSKGRAKSFERLYDTEYWDLKKLLYGFTHQQFLDGIYSIASELNIIPDKATSRGNDEKIIEHLKAKGIINKSNWFKLKNPKGDLIRFDAPFQKQSYYVLSLISNALGQVYLERSSEMN